MDIKRKLGKRIKEIRLSKNISQEFVAEQLNINPSNYSRIETGYSYPRADNLEKICAILEVTPKELFSFEHHDDIEKLKAELISLIDRDENLLKLVYKFVKCIVE